MTVKQLRATAGGKDRIIGFWRHGDSGVFAGLYEIAREARNNVEGLQIASMNINSDKRLSEDAKREDRKGAAKGRLQFLGQLQRRLDEVRLAHNKRAAEMSAVTPYRDGDFSAVQIDLALATQLRAMTPAERNAELLIGTNKAYVEASLRLPRELTGISADWYARVQKEAIARAHPHAAQEMEDLYQAAEDAQDAVRTAFGLIVIDGGISLDERVEAAGESAQDLVKGISPATVERIQDRLKALSADEDDDLLKKQLQGAA